jgi:transposase
VRVVEDPHEPVPEIARPILTMLIETLHALDDRIALLDRAMTQRAQADDTARRLSPASRTILRPSTPPTRPSCSKW